MKHLVVFIISLLVFQDPDADTSTADKLDTSISEWEDVSVDIEKWNVLIRQLEDVLALNCLLKIKIPPAKNTAVSVSPSSELLMVSVRHLLDGGRGNKSYYFLFSFFFSSYKLPCYHDHLFYYFFAVMS